MDQSINTYQNTFDTTCDTINKILLFVCFIIIIIICFKLSVYLCLICFLYMYVDFFVHLYINQPE